MTKQKNKFSGKLAIFCSDERFVKKTMEFASKVLGTRNCDLMASPGGPVFILNKDKNLLDGLKLLVEKHAIKKIALFAHYDCGYYKNKYKKFDEKELLKKQVEDVKYKFAQLKYRQEYQFSKKITRIIEDIEYARENGSFPAKLDYSKLTATGSNITSSFVIKEGGKEVGYYTFGSGYFKYYKRDKPNFVVRFCMNKLLDFRWVDEK